MCRIVGTIQRTGYAIQYCNQRLNPPSLTLPWRDACMEGFGMIDLGEESLNSRRVVRGFSKILSRHGV